MRSRQIVLAFLAAALPCVAASAQMDRSELVKVAPSVVKIEAISADGRFQLGSGVIVSEGTVATNCHVTRNAERVAVIKGGIRWLATRQAADTTHDLCLLRVPTIEGDVVPIARAETLKVGQPVMGIGYTGGVMLQLSEGAVVALHALQGSKIIQSSNWFSSGASGGGLFTADGTLVGILTFRLRGGAAHYFAAPADWLLERVRDEKAFKTIAPLQGRTFWEEMAERQPYFLQAAALQQAKQWDALARLGERWARESSGDAESSYVVGLAYDNLGRTEASISSLERCTVLDPNYAPGWAKLAEIYKREGRPGDARTAIRRLEAIDPEQARDLSQAMETR